MDKTDYKILDELKKNARISFVDLARKLKVSESTVRNRVSQLESSGVIKKYTAVIEPSKLGFGSVALVGIDVKPEKFLDIGKSLSELDNVKFVSTSTGDHMLMVEVWTENASELRSFIREKIETLDGVTRTCPAILMERLKEA